MSASAHSSTAGHQIGKTSTNTAKASEPETEHEEFQIAADLTLYANPLRCLQKRTTPIQPSTTEPKKNAEEAGDIIAADLTKYGSPLDDKN